ncbi:MAG: TPM domain-containing protein [Planctomycetota bacterium]
MDLHDPDLLGRIEKAVADAEKGTSAEIVVVITPQSGSYLDRELLFGVAIGLVALAFLIFSPWAFHPALAFVDFLLAFGLATLVCNRVSLLKGFVVRERRREKNVTAGSLISFVHEGVGATRERNGILVFASLFEGAVRILPDFGIEGKVGESEWNRILQEIGRPSSGEMGEAILGVTERVGKVLAGAFPPGEENPDEIPNAPRILG